MKPHTQVETVDANAATMTLSLDMDLYPRDVVYGAAYVFLDRAYVLLDRDGPRVLVHLRGKQPLDDTELRAMAGEFENELLAQALRQRVFKANQSIIETITSLAIGSAAGAWPRSSTEPANDSGAVTPAIDDGRDFLDDPHGISAPWHATESDGGSDGTDT